MRRAAAMPLLAALAATTALVGACSHTQPQADIPAASTTTAVKTLQGDTSVEVGGARVHVRCTGVGAPTVVLVAGFGEDATTWSGIEGRIDGHRVCVYDRFGTGTSDAPPAVQTFGSEATDLHSVLRKVGAVPPYILVGHSFGGDETVVYANRYRGDVAALLLIDASPVGWLHVLCTVADDGSRGEQTFRAGCNTFVDPAQNPERLDTTTAFTEAAAVHSLDPMPIVIDTAANHGYVDAGFSLRTASGLADLWTTGQRGWQRLSSNAQLVAVDAGHHIHQDKPDLILEQLNALAAASGTGDTP